MYQTALDFQTNSSQVRETSKTQNNHEDANTRVPFLEFLKNQTKTRPYEDPNPQRKLFPKEEEIGCQSSFSSLCEREKEEEEEELLLEKAKS